MEPTPLVQLSRAQWRRIALMVGAAAGFAVLSLRLLLPSWDDARLAISLAMGHSAREINQEVAESPLPPQDRAVAGPRGSSLPPRPKIPAGLALTLERGGPTPPPNGSRFQREYEMQKRQYQFYLDEIHRAGVDPNPRVAGKHR